MPSGTLGFSSFADQARRYFVGTAMTPCLRFTSGAILKVDGRGLNAGFELIHQLNIRTPPDVRALLEQGGAGLSSGSQLPGMASRMVAELHVVNVERLLNACGISAEKVTAIGKRGPTSGRQHWTQTGFAQTIGDSTIVAESTGVTVIDHFEQRDLAKGGSALGIDVLPMWMLFTKAVDSYSARPTVVVRMDQAIELFYLPARRRNRHVPALSYRNIGPGFALLAKLQPLCGHRYDATKSLGSKLGELMNSHEAVSISIDSPPAMSNLVEAIGDELPDLLASSPTLNQAMEAYWAEHIYQQITEHFPEAPEFAEIVILGRGARREKFVERLADKFPGIPVTTEVSRGWISGAPGACVAAIFAALHVDQISGNLPELTGATAARVLGRITPGNPANWRGVLAQMDVASKHAIPLREAV